MNKNLRLILVLLLLAAVAGYFFVNNSGGTLREELTDFAVEDTASITRIYLVDDGGRSVLLDRKGPNAWRVNDTWSARQDAVNTLLATIHQLRVKAPVPKGAFDRVVKNIASDHVKVEVYQGGDAPSKVFFVGGSNADHSGTHMLLDNSTVPFVMHLEGFHGFITPRFFTNVNDWKSSSIFAFDYGEIASVKVDYPGTQGKSFEVVCLEDANRFELYDPSKGTKVAQFDTSRVMQFLTHFKKIHFESFEETKTQLFIDSVQASTPMHIYTVIDREGKSTEVKAYLKPIYDYGEDLEGNPIDHDIDRFYGWINEGDFVVLQYFVFDKITLDLAYFLPRETAVNKS